MFMCVCSLTQASWEKRVLKSLNSVSTELGVPLARMVAKILSISVNLKLIFRICSKTSVIMSHFDDENKETFHLASTKCKFLSSPPPKKKNSVAPWQFQDWSCSCCVICWNPLSHSAEACSGAEGAHRQVERDGHGWTRSQDVNQGFDPKQCAFP